MGFVLFNLLDYLSINFVI